MAWLKRLFHKHDFTNYLTVSGYRLTEYQAWFCKKCTSVFGIQTKNFNGEK